MDPTRHPCPSLPIGCTPALSVTYSAAAACISVMPFTFFCTTWFSRVVRTTARRRRCTYRIRTSGSTLRCQCACSTATGATLERSPVEGSRSSRNRRRRNSLSRTPTVSAVIYLKQGLVKEFANVFGRRGAPQFRDPTRVCHFFCISL